MRSSVTRLTPAASTWARFIAALVVLLLIALATAQQCTTEQEPNDDPAAATMLEGVGPNSGSPLGDADLPIVCLTGELEGDDQDAYVWVVDEVGAAQAWTMEVEGAPGALTQVDLFAVTFAADGAGVLSADGLFRFGTTDGTWSTSEPFMVAPGRYVLGVSGAGGAADYVAYLRPRALSADSDEHRPERPLGGEFDVFAPAADGPTVSFAIDEEDAAFALTFSLRAPVGSNPDLAVEGAPGEVARAEFEGPGPVRLVNLALDPGEYVARVVPAESVVDGGYVRLSLARSGRFADGIEVEENDDFETATRLKPGQEVSGTLDGRDVFRIELDAEQAASAWSLVLDASDEVEVELFSANEVLLQERNGVRGTAADLHLDGGHYFLRLTGRDDLSYTVALLSGQVAADGFEREPNDFVQSATELGPEAHVRGELAAQDTDVFALRVEGEAQLYRVQVVGAGVEELALLDSGGSELTSVSGERRIRLDGLDLLPGTHFLRVSGVEGEYALRVLSLGPAPEPEPTEDAPRADEELAPAEPADVENALTDDEAADPGTASLSALPPPPAGVLESEPNDDGSRSLDLRPDVVHVGRLSSEDDEDHYRFHLANAQYVRVELMPAEGETAWSLGLDGRRYSALPDSGGHVVAESWLLAGDHSVRLDGGWLDSVPSGYYQLRLAHLGALGLPVDREPNDEPAEAVSLPAGLAWSARVGESGDRDHYVLPAFQVATEVTLVARDGGDVRYELNVGDGWVRFESGGDEGGSTLTIPAGEPADLRVSGEGEYQVELSFSAPPPEAALDPVPGTGDLSASLALATDAAAAFWHEGQRIEGELTVRNEGPSEVEVTLTTFVSRPEVVVEGPANVSVPAGGQATLPVALLLPADMASGSPLTVQASAATPEGLAVAETEVALRCEAAPVGGHPRFLVPDALLGRPNVLFAGFGAAPPAGFQGNNRDYSLHDGSTTVRTGGWLGPDHSPTFELPGDEPVSLIGTVLNPSSDARVERQLRRFRVEASLDGTTYEAVLEAELSSARIDQSFQFAEPVDARYVRLVAVDGYAGQNEAYVGEWKLIAQDPAFLSGLDLLRPELGGQVVWTDPLVTDSSRAGLLTVENSVSRVDFRGAEALRIVVGFENGRAAMVRGVAWLQPEVDPERLHGEVDVSVSLAGPVGPWRPIGRWPLGGPGQTTEVDFDTPVWARYVMYTAPVGADQEFTYPPARLSAYEREVSEDYLSALSEWGTDTTIGPYEFLAATATARPAATEVDAGEDRSTATPVAGGTSVTGTVAVAEDIDWYRIDVPNGQNHLELRLSGEPTIDYTYELTTADGVAVPYELGEDGANVVLSAFVGPGDYYLGLEEPKRNIIFAWDTSGSVAPYQPITYSSLASFARQVDGDREFVQLLAFQSPSPIWLLPFWSSDTERVQRSLTEWDRNADSSNAELALLTATEGLRGRDGTKAVLFITDAESGGYDLSGRLWSALSEVRPRVFTFEVSTGGNERPQQLMQNWAAVNGGTYDMSSGVGDFDAGFARATCLLRRPKRYTVAVTTSTTEPPGPGTLTVTQAASAAQGAVEVIFDASGSMGQSLPSGEQRIVAARRALEALVGEVLPADTPFALRAFGHIAPSSCETRLDVPLGTLDREAALTAVRAIEPKLLSQTAIADSLAFVADDLAAADGPRTVILITDGEESCGGDPAAAARDLRATGDVAIAIVSLALEPGSLAVFEDLAESIGASYVDVASYEALSEAIADALVPTFEVYDAAGTVVATGRVGESVELPMGVYSVRVLSAPAEVFEGVRVPGDGSVQVVAGAH